jgi:hypothetical protein
VAQHAVAAAAQADDCSTEDPTLSFRKEEAGRAQGTQIARSWLEKTNSDRNYLLAKQRLDNANDPTPDGFEKGADGTYHPLPGGPQDPAYQASVAKAKGDNPTIIGAGSSVSFPTRSGLRARCSQTRPVAGRSTTRRQTSLPSEACWAIRAPLSASVVVLKALRTF